MRKISEIRLAAALSWSVALLLLGIIIVLYVVNDNNHPASHYYAAHNYEGERNIHMDGIREIRERHLRESETRTVRPLFVIGILLIIVGAVGSMVTVVIIGERFIRKETN